MILKHTPGPTARLRTQAALPRTRTAPLRTPTARLRVQMRALTLLAPLTLLATLTLHAAIDASASADTFFNNFGPNDTYQTSSGVGFGGSNPSFEQAMGFTPDAAYLLTGGEFAVTLSFGQNPSTFSIRVHADAAGLPGPVLEEVTLHENLGPFGLLHPPVTVNFAGTTLLNAGTPYWISMSAPAITDAVWNTNSIGDLGPRAFNNNGSGWVLSSATYTRSAFRLEGTLIPAPGAIGLLGLIACATRRRRKA